MALIALLKSHFEASTYTLDMPTKTYNMYHIFQLKQHIVNDSRLFLTLKLLKPGPIVTPEGLEEVLVENIVVLRISLFRVII
jgi:hypothetical protein